MNQSLTTTTNTPQKIDGFSRPTSEGKTNNNIKMNTELNQPLITALNKYTKEQLYSILTNWNSSYKMTKKERKTFTNADYIKVIVEELSYNQAWVDNIIKGEEWVLERGGKQKRLDENEAIFARIRNTPQLIIALVEDPKATLPVYQLAKKNNFYPEQVYNFLFRDFSPDHPVSKLPKPIREQLSKAFANYDKYDFQLTLLKRDKALVGFAFWTCPKENNGKCCLEFLLIDGPDQGKGYAKILMDNFIRWADANRPHILIQIPSKDERCKHFYTKYGFKPKNPADTSELVNWERAV